MKTFAELYQQAAALAFSDDPAALERARADYDPDHLDCLLNPQKHPLIIRTGACNCPPEQRAQCASRCPFDAMEVGEDGNIRIDPEACVGCEDCIEGCDRHNLAASTDILAALKAIRSANGLVYALIAPAYLGQFSSAVTPGKLRTAFKEVGFDGMIEVALFADILTLKEALEFDRNIVTEADYQLTSCCCPMWIAMIRKIYHELIPHVPGSVSPMIACARTIKALYPDALTVFIGPCLAKKAEAREKDLKGAVDYVLTFNEVRTVFDLLGIDPATREESEKDHSSRAGRIYARTGGVSEAVRETVKRISPNRGIEVRTRQADGVPACKAMMNDIRAGKGGGNFYEGMGCVGGCVGGPRAITSAQEGTIAVNAYAEGSQYRTPAENPYVMELLDRLGFQDIESLIKHGDIFTRHFQ
ncbi:MAG: [Fe-Fe] hydrogenase large subunit C-terminal domain-containing protein [Christensenellales bacterium]|jgi:iron only hydrogenase large subunit-like protein